MSNEHQHGMHTPVPAAPTVVATPTPPKKEKPDLSKVVPYNIERNGIKKALTPFAGSRGAWDGKIYQAPQIEDEAGKSIPEDSTFLTNLSWFGKENVKRFLNVIARRMAQDYWDDAIPEKDDEAGFPEGSKAGIFVESLFIKAMTEFAAASLKISELNELYNDAVDALKNETTGFIAEMTAAAGDADKMKIAGDKFKQLSDNVNSLKLELEARKARRSKEAQTETVTPE